MIIKPLELSMALNGIGLPFTRNGLGVEISMVFDIY
jgi:hypothetical protein